MRREARSGELGWRDLDRYEIRRESGSLVVMLDALHRADEKPESFRTAVIVLA